MRTTASREQVWQVLTDGWSYADWVVGAARIRGVEGPWPEPGARILHTVGLGRAGVDDDTVVLDCDPGRRLLLRAGVGPFGGARVVLELTDLAGGGCEIRMDEDVSHGLGLLALGPVRRFALDVRNAEALRRLVRIAEQHVAGRGPLR